MEKSKLILSIIVAAIVKFFEPVEALIVATFILATLDVATGIYVAWKINKEQISSKKLVRKMNQVILVIVGIASTIVADPFFIEFGLSQHQPAKWLVAIYGIYEFFSVLENLGNAGLPVASQFKEFLKNKIKNDVEIKDKEEMKDDNAKRT